MDTNDTQNKPPSTLSGEMLGTPGSMLCLCLTTSLTSRSWMVQKRWSRSPGVSVRIPLFARLGHTCSLQSVQKQHARYADSASPTILMYNAGYTGSKGPPETTPFSKSKLADLPQFAGQHAEDLLWSTFRPGQYFGEKKDSTTCTPANDAMTECTGVTAYDFSLVA